MIESNPKELLTELIHHAAYRSQGLGMPNYFPLHMIGHIKPEMVHQQLKTYHSYDRMVCIGIGEIDHNELASSLQDITTRKAEQLDSSKNESVIKLIPSPYQGGEIQIAGNFNTHLALAFEGSGFSNKDLFTFGTLQFLLGGGKRLFSDGLKNNQSKLFKVMEKNSYIQELNAFHYSYSDSGLFGISVVSSPGYVPNVLQELTSSLISIKKGNFDKNDIERARLQFKADLLFTTEKRNSLLEFIAAQVFSSNSVLTPDEFVKSIDSVKAEDIISLSKKMLTCFPTFVILGDIYNNPSIPHIQSLLNK